MAEASYRSWASRGVLAVHTVVPWFVIGLIAALVLSLAVPGLVPWVLATAVAIGAVPATWTGVRVTSSEVVVTNRWRRVRIPRDAIAALDAESLRPPWLVRREHMSLALLVLVVQDEAGTQLVRMEGTAAGRRTDRQQAVAVLRRGSLSEPVKEYLGSGIVMPRPAR